MNSSKASEISAADAVALDSDAVAPDEHAKRALSKASNTSEVMRQRAKQTTASFKQPTLWVLIFGWTLAGCAGFVNTVCFRSFGYFVSHATGTTSKIGMRIEGFFEGHHDFEELDRTIRLLMSFLIGAYMCGLLIDKNQVHFGGKSLYGVALIGNACLLVAAVSLSLSGQSDIVCACFAAVACGLQNAMCTSHFGAVVRTTHVTGTVTDIGSTLGRMTTILLRKGCVRRKLNVVEKAELLVDFRKVVVLIPMWLSFLAGCIFGAYMETRFGVYSLLIPGIFTFLIGSMYTLLRQSIKGAIKQMERERLSRATHDMHDKLDRIRHKMHDMQEFHRSASFDNLNSMRSEMIADIDEDVEEMCEDLSEIEGELEDLCDMEKDEQMSQDTRSHWGPHGGRT